MTSETQLLTLTPAETMDECALRVRAGMRAPHIVTSLLYSKFCEHLGNNIYQGMDAQILRNPTFGEWNFRGGSRPDGGLAYAYDEEHARSACEHMGRRVHGNPEAMVEAVGACLAFWWTRVGDADRTVFTPDVGPGGRRAQRIEIADGDGPAGIAQALSLPLHRTRRYLYRVVARAIGGAKVTLALRSADGAHADTATLTFGDDWTAREGTLEMPADAPADGAYSVSLTTEGVAHIVLATATLLPDDHVDGADPDVVRFLREARLPLLRWPGGNFVSGYRWRLGVGPVDERPAVPNPAWAGLEYNLFGTHEFMAFCRAVGCEPMICVNAGDGSAEEAAAWVEYCNGATDTPMGALRARNGHPEPFGVRYWEVGNEIYGRWQVGHTTPAGNVDRFLRFSRAMRDADPSIRLLACGFESAEKWDAALIEGAAGEFDAITAHPLWGGRVEASVDPVNVYHGFMSSAPKMVDVYRRNCKAMAARGVERPRVAVTELQMFAHYQWPEDHEHEPGEHVPIPTPDTISEALYHALIVNECIRAGDIVEMITHSATVNHGGGLRKVRERVWACPVHYEQAMGMALAGGVPVAVELACPVLPGEGPNDRHAPYDDMPVLDAMAVLQPDAGELVVMLVNRSAVHGTAPLRVDVDGFEPSADVERVALVGSSFIDHNTIDEPERVVPRTDTLQCREGGLVVDLPPFSVTRLRFRGAPGA